MKNKPIFFSLWLLFQFTLLVLLVLHQQNEIRTMQVVLNRTVYIDGVLIDSADVLFKDASSTRERIGIIEENQMAQYQQFLDLYFKTDPDFLASSKKLLESLLKNPSK